MLHFVYKSRSTSQYTSPELEAPYNDHEEEERSVQVAAVCFLMWFLIVFMFCVFVHHYFRLFGLYLYLHHHIHSSGQPLRILCHVGSKEMLLGWVRVLLLCFFLTSPVIMRALKYLILPNHIIRSL